MSRRNFRILMDNISGMSMAAIAEREGLNPSRIGQICQSVLRRFGLDRSMSKQAIGARLARAQRAYQPLNTPEGFYYEVESERRNQLWAGRQQFYDEMDDGE